MTTAQQKCIDNHLADMRDHKQKLHRHEVNHNVKGARSEKIRLHTLEKELLEYCNIIGEDYNKIREQL